MELKTETEFMQTVPIQVAEDHRFVPPVHHTTPAVPINDAIQIKAAEYWLKLGEADQALKELEKLPQDTWKNRAAIKIRIAAMGMLRERGEQVEVL